MSERPAFYALSPGGWRDYVTLLHPPYTLWHLSYVAIGSATAVSFNGGYLSWSLLAFFLAVGLAAHALDELRGRPLGTRIPGWVLVGIAAVGLGGAVTIGILGTIRVSAWLAGFIAGGTFLALSYNLELFGGRFHTDLWFALGWGGFPALTGAFAQTGKVAVAGLAAAVACTAISAAQRTLSTPVRRSRRAIVALHGEPELVDGTRERLDPAVLRHAPEAALRLLSLAMPILAAGLVAARLQTR